MTASQPQFCLWPFNFSFFKIQTNPGMKQGLILLLAHLPAEIDFKWKIKSMIT